MTERKPINLKVLLFMGAFVLVVTSAIAIFFAVTYTPSGPTTPTSTVAPTSAIPTP